MNQKGKPITAIDDEADYELTCDEFDLHDWITSINHTMTMPRNLVGPNGETYFNRVSIDWHGYKPEADALDEFDPVFPDEADRIELEQAVNKFLEARGKLDALIHDIAEYTC